MFNTKVFADGADLKSIAEIEKNPLVKGFTTNPSLIRKAGVADYMTFAKDLLRLIPNKPVSFEVFADTQEEMEQQAYALAELGSNVYVKIPVTNTKKEPTYPLLYTLSKAKVSLNVTAVFTLEQVEKIVEHLSDSVPSIISIFAGRIADTGVDPIPLMKKALKTMAKLPHCEVLWASPREVLNYVQARQIGCHIITMTNDLIKKISLLNKNLDEYSLETVKMFYDDALSAGYTIPCTLSTGKTHA